MSNYSKVQFISWELYTGPFKVTENTGVYSGLLDPTPDNRTDALGQCWDIDARVKFVADAISKAAAAIKPDASVLKVFMAPEFLFRGAGGAYLHDLINGWAGAAPAEFNLPAPYDKAWPGLFGQLRALVADSKFEDWLFVFGTAVSASFPAARQRDGKYRLITSQAAETYNSALVQRGGVNHGNDCYVSRKHYISPIDFIRWYGAVKQHRPGTVRPLEPRTVLPADVLGVPEGGALFRIAGMNDGGGKPIDFGIEVCLDHALSGNSTNQYGRLRAAGQLVKIQLVPSGGMSLEPDSIRLLPGRSYAFNCDGLAQLAPDGANPPYGSHTQLWNGPNRPANVLAEFNNGVVTPGSNLQAVTAQVLTTRGPVDANQLWNNGFGVSGAGHVRVDKTLYDL